jgi:glutamate-1-semialdehyde 2,1-aminomutase
MWGHLHAARLPANYPQFFARAEGGHVWDVDGRRHVDLMCSWGPVVLGHRDAVVEAAARR